MIPEPHRRFAAVIGRALADRWSAQSKNRTNHDGEKETPRPSFTECNQPAGFSTVTDSDSVVQRQELRKSLD